MAHLSVKDLASRDSIKAIEQDGRFASVGHIKCALKVSKNGERMLQFGRAPLYVTVPDRRDGTRQVADHGFIQADDQSGG